MDQIANQAAKMKYMFGGEASLPLTITTTGGAGLSAAAQHSQSLEAGLPIPGPQGRVFRPTPMTSRACWWRDSRRQPDDRVTHKACSAPRARSPRSSTRFRSARPPPAGGHRRHHRRHRPHGQRGSTAAEKLADEGIDVEVIDPRTLQPLDTETIVSPRADQPGDRRHEAVRFGGIGAEIAAQIQEEAFDYLDAPMAGSLLRSRRFRSARRSKRTTCPSANDIEQAIRDIVARPGA